LGSRRLGKFWAIYIYTYTYLKHQDTKLIFRLHQSTS